MAMTPCAAFGGKGSSGDELWFDVTTKGSSSLPGAKVKGMEALPPLDKIS